MTEIFEKNRIKRNGKQLKKKTLNSSEYQTRIFTLFTMIQSELIN